MANRSTTESAACLCGCGARHCTPTTSCAEPCVAHLPAVPAIAEHADLGAQLVAIVRGIKALGTKNPSLCLSASASPELVAAVAALPGAYTNTTEAAGKLITYAIAYVEDVNVSAQYGVLIPTAEPVAELGQEPA